MVNVGRASTIDHDALLAASKNGKIGGVALDVLPQEPLESVADLWLAPNCIVSPHAASGRPQGAEDLIHTNMELLLSDNPLVNSAMRGSA